MFTITGKERLRRTRITVDNRGYHYLSQNATDTKITSAKRISQHLSDGHRRQKGSGDRFSSHAADRVTMDKRYGTLREPVVEPT